MALTPLDPNEDRKFRNGETVYDVDGNAYTVHGAFTDMNQFVTLNVNNSIEYALELPDMRDCFSRKNPKDPDPVQTCPGCGITVFVSSDNASGYCTGCTKAGREWVFGAERSTDRYEVHENLSCERKALPDRRYRYRVRAPWSEPTRPWWNGLPSTQHGFTSSVQTELSTLWMASNPELAVDSIRRFQEEHPAEEWGHGMNMERKGFIKLIAVRRK